ncbi:MAG TPA: hypothetical protein PKD51_19575, partial [Saprospiraceae bacterium]|nr:hypothetical protein [Saprospiraceae bacterium]
VGMVLTTPITGLSASTTYYVRVRADIGGCFSTNSGSLTVLTNCTAVTIPITEGFEDNINGLDCWRISLVSGTNNWGIATAPSSDISAAQSGTDFAIKSFSTSNALLTSLPLNYSTVSNGTRINTYLHRHASAHVNDQYKIFVNTSNTLTGATEIFSLFSQTSQVPTVPSTGWYNYLIDIPLSYHGEPLVYIIFQGITTSGFSSYDLGIDDFKVEYIPTDAVDWGNLQFPGSGTIYTTNAFDTYGQTYEPGVTEGAGQGTGVLAWLGYNTADTDPNTWTNWIPATFNVQVGNNDEFIGTIPANTLTPGTYYYAYRYQLSGGPFVYGGYKASGGGIWDGSNNVSGVLTVNACPSVSASATMTTICQNTSTTISATSANPNYTYLWNPGSLVGASHLVTPMSSTTYTVTATDLSIACSNTGTVTIMVNPVPSAVEIIPTAVVVCTGGNAALLTASGGNIDMNGKIGAGVALNTLSTPYKAFWGGNRTQALYSAAELNSLGLVSGSSILSIGYELLSGTPLQMNDFEIKIGLVSNTTLGTAFISGASYVVFSNTTYLPSSGTGPIDYALSSPLVWDGTSSLLVETCFNNNNGGGVASNSLSVQSSTVSTGLNLYLSQDNEATVCNNLTAPSSTTNRPNLRMTHRIPTEITWSGLTGLFTNMSATNAYLGEDATSVYALPPSTTTYTATSSSTNGCTSSASVTVGVEGTIVKNTADAGLNSLRSVYNCITEGGTITYDQPTTTATVLTTPLNITKSVTIQGLSAASRPEITVPTAGVSVDATKTLTLQNVDVKSSGTATFTGAGDVSITGTTVGKQ